MVEVGTSMAVAPQAGSLLRPAGPTTDGERERLGRLPDVQIEEWAGDGHFVHLVDPERFAIRAPHVRRTLRPDGLTVASAGAGLASTAITAQRARTSPAGASSGRPERLATRSILCRRVKRHRSQARAQPCPRSAVIRRAMLATPGRLGTPTLSHAPNRPVPRS
jgi:hypothetical protein